MASKKSPAPPVDFCATASALNLLRAVAGEEMFQAALPILREQMALTPQKLATILELAINPHAHIEKGREADVRGLNRETLKGYKDAKLLPEFIGFSTPA